MNPSSPRIFVAGHRGMVGSAIVRALAGSGATVITRSHDELDLCDQQRVRDFFDNELIDAVYLAAAKVGGIHANNTYPAEFIHQNLLIASNVIHEAWRSGVQRLLFLGSSCIYPAYAAQPITEDALLTGPLEPTNAPYAIAKIAGIKLCESYNRQYGTDYRCVMPTNLYGPGDNYHPDNSHVIPGLLRRFHEAAQTGASEVVVWGTGRPLREFLHADDMGRACVHVMGLSPQAYREHAGSAGFFNVGSDDEVSIGTLAQLIAETVGFRGEIRFDPSKPDGTPRKRLDSTAIGASGWAPTIGLREGLAMAYRDALASGRLGAPAAAPATGARGAVCVSSNASLAPAVG
ncbi:GDP-L-fucose synthase [Cupriavidus sp. AU9028]|uniref:GDP-L-fucose synthase family protein n=1 Tax=Cupriavidus sp. AU9028 TaxID=2871157 RepID=UPI001C97D561|nr:GDP-L-fucose synthase [Cupriavidus sp. AU9028]MBY4896843.1 GDP-L-fucose synthase [Cupriavidus sp. AU9028]